MHDLLENLLQTRKVENRPERHQNNDGMECTGMHGYIPDR